jgi:hypothetical protein
MRTEQRRAMRINHVLTWCADWDTGPAGVTALLADIRHWCDTHGECFARLDRVAYEQYLDDRDAQKGGAA